MKTLLLLTFYCLTLTAFGQRLNDTIFKAQKRAVKTSPYLDAKRFLVPEAQSKFRLTKFPKSLSKLLLDKEHLTDTLWIVESFDDMCPTCTSYKSDILYKNSLYTYDEFNSRTNRGNNFIATSFGNRNLLYHYIISEVVDKVRQKRKWLSNPLIYGAYFCNDGDHTLITIVYPDLHIQSLYVRCWTQPEHRTNSDAPNNSIANSGAGRWSNQQHIAISFGSGGRNSFEH